MSIKFTKKQLKNIYDNKNYMRCMYDINITEAYELVSELKNRIRILRYFADEQLERRDMITPAPGEIFLDDSNFEKMDEKLKNLKRINNENN